MVLVSESRRVVQSFVPNHFLQQSNSTINNQIQQPFSTIKWLYFHWMTIIDIHYVFAQRIIMIMIFNYNAIIHSFDCLCISKNISIQLDRNIWLFTHHFSIYILYHEYKNYFPFWSHMLDCNTFFLHFLDLQIQFKRRLVFHRV